MNVKTPTNKNMTNTTAIVSSAGDKKFVAKTNLGIEIFFEPSPLLGESGDNVRVLITEFFQNFFRDLTIS